MKRIDINNTKLEQPHFIGSWNIENNDLCKKIIDFFEENKSLQTPGITDKGVNLNIKNTTDIRVSPDNLKDTRFKCLNEYISELYKCYVDYQDQWPFLKNIIPNIDIGAFNIQKYSSGGHYGKIHTERSGLSNLHRVFAWMIYLNDVDDGGSTNFSHYDIKVKPEIGKTLIWPAEWTHAHSGEILNSGFKYIVTGWMHFPHND
tara:strand:+ start:213 stop:821 length:609 start_codon:yes stop_codon:yes gene_type:complete